MPGVSKFGCTDENGSCVARQCGSSVGAKGRTSEEEKVADTDHGGRFAAIAIFTGHQSADKCFYPFAYAYSAISSGIIAKAARLRPMIPLPDPRRPAASIGSASWHYHSAFPRPKMTPRSDVAQYRGQWAGSQGHLLYGRWRLAVVRPDRKSVV